MADRTRPTVTREPSTRRPRARSSLLASAPTHAAHSARAPCVTGLITAVLGLPHRLIPPTLHYATPNPTIDFDTSPLFVNAQLREWESAAGTPRRAGVTSLGVGGTNAHVVLEEAPPRPPVAVGGGRQWQALLLSARSEAALSQMAENLAAHLREHPEEPLVDI